MLILALDIVPYYPWAAVLALSTACALAPFLVARYRTTAWQIPQWHYFAWLALAGIWYYSYVRYRQSVRGIDHFMYLFDNEVGGPRIVRPDHHDPVVFSSTAEILLDFSLLTGLPALFSLLLSLAVYRFKKARKHRA